MNIFSKRPLAIILAVFMLMIALLLFVAPWVKILLILLSAISVWVLFWRARKEIFLIGVVISVLISSLLSFLYFDHYIGKAKAYFNTNSMMCIEIVDVNYSKEYSTYADVIIHKIGEEKVDFPAKLECTYALDGERGDMYVIKGVIGDFENNGTFDLKRYYNSKGCYLNIISEENKISYLGKAPFEVKAFFLSINSYCERRLSTILDDDTFGLVSALFLGNRDNVDPSIERDFSQIGITHMLAVSGTHLTVLIGGLYGILRFFGVHRKAVVSLSIAVCILYIGMTGGAPCVLRSGIMYIIMSISFLVFRENDSITSLFTASALIILFSPNSIYDAGFLLSVFSTLGILVVIPYLAEFTYAAKQKSWLLSCFAAFVSGVVITLAASLFTLPLNAMFFGRVYALIVLSNLLFSFFFSVLLWLAPFAVFLSYIPYFKDAIAWLCDLICGVIIKGTHLMASLDFGSVSLDYPFVPVLLILLVASIVFMILLGVKNPFWCFVPLAVFCVAYAISAGIFLSGFNSYEYVACLNTQRSDIITVHSSGNTAVVDISYGGRTMNENAIATAKESFFDDKVEAYIVTHYHNYHPGTIDKITRSHFINVVYIPLPCDDDERLVANTIKIICQNNGVSIRYYTKNGVRISDSATIVTIPDKIKRSVHDTIRVDIDVSGYTLSYFGGGVIESESGKNFPETVFFGSHGPLVKEFDDIQKCKVALYSNREIKDSYNVDSKEEYILEESDGVEILRIPKRK